MLLKLTPVNRRYEYEDLKDGDIFSINYGYGEKDFFVMHIDNNYLHAVSLKTGKKLLMSGSYTVQLYEKEFVYNI